jgi:hypothetical protein
MILCSYGFLQFLVAPIRPYTGDHGDLSPEQTIMHTEQGSDAQGMVNMKIAFFFL